MNDPDIPVFAIIGHPNEGKSSVVSTLTGDDRIPISPIPGETIRNERVSWKAHGREMIQFVDTPGFQNPLRTLKWFEENASDHEGLLDRFLKEFAHVPGFDHDCELLKPLAEGAGVVFVADGSRPIGKTDLAEMEILRLAGNPRMGVINSKSDLPDYLENWKREFRKHFNATFLFDACRASFRNRIELLESLKNIEQNWNPPLEKAIAQIRSDREGKRKRTADLIFEELEHSLVYKKSRLLADEHNSEVVKEELENAFREGLRSIEERTWDRILKEFNHTRLNVSVAREPVLSEDLFSDQTWQVLGLNGKQLALSAAALGGGAGVGLDVLFGGISFGVFAASGAVTGAIAALLKDRSLAKLKLKRIPIGGYEISIGPNQNPQFPFILLDRAFLLYQMIANRAHARQDKEATFTEEATKVGPCSQWSPSQRSVCVDVINAIKSGKRTKLDDLRPRFTEILLETLIELEESQNVFEK